MRSMRSLANVFVINHLLFNYFISGTLMTEFARLGPPVPTVGSDIDTNGLNVSSSVTGKKKKKKRRHRYDMLWHDITPSNANTSQSEN